MSGGLLLMRRSSLGLNTQAQGGLRWAGDYVDHAEAARHLRRRDTMLGLF